MTDLYELLALEHLYEVKVGGELLGQFLEVSGLGIEYEVHEYAEGGRNDFVYRHRGRLKQSNLTLKSGVTAQTVLLDWVLSGEPRNLHVTFKTDAEDDLRTFSFAHALPIRWTGPNANIGANNVATESLEIVHRGMNAGSGGG